ncbi:MAG: DNA translocase FtsK, partial [Chitinivibrionales bacterium]|nr:DNA translocase FtsK [Chitinivibrionales bacterium]
MSKEAKTESAETRAKKKPAATAHFMLEIWGVVFCSFGILVVISLVSHLLQGGANVLGRYVGADLAVGLIYLFGNIPAFFFPVVLIGLGWSYLGGSLSRPRLLLFGFLFTFEICGVLALADIPFFGIKDFNFPDNACGNAQAYCFWLVFGPHVLGPCFIMALALIITIAAALRTNISTVIAIVWRFLKALSLWAIALFKRRPAPVSEPVAEPAAAKKSRQKKIIPEALPAAAEEGSVDPSEKIPPTVPGALPQDPFEAESDRVMEEELAVFRAKKNEPIKITTIETADFTTEFTDEKIDPVLEEALIENAVEETPVAAKHRSAILSSKTAKPYVLPHPDILTEPPPVSSLIDREGIERHSHILEKTLMNFGIEGKVVNVSPGPIITRYEIELAPGVKVSRIISLQDDISMAVGGQKIRVEAPIPGKAAIGIELPNQNRQTVYFKHILVSDQFQKTGAKLPIVVGRNISGLPFVTDITKMPHMLIAGQTGSGKSVAMNSFICSLLMTKSPQELRLILIDPKKVEMAYYEGIPHLLAPVVTESREAVKALHWATIEMGRRYDLLKKVGARNIDSFNMRLESGRIADDILTEEEKVALPFIVIVVDELADLMITARGDVETLVQRIAQLARAVGLHLIVATQRPSVDIITGPIKANLTSRVAFRTIQSVDSRTILGYIGSEKLLGNGDMLFLRNGASDIERFHGAFISEEDVEIITGEIKKQNVEIDKLESFDETGQESMNGEGEGGSGVSDDRDELFAEAARMVVSIGQGSTSLLQRRMKIGFARAGRLMDELEQAGIVGPQ